MDFTSLSPAKLFKQANHIPLLEPEVTPPFPTTKPIFHSSCLLTLFLITALAWPYLVHVVLLPWTVEYIRLRNGYQSHLSRVGCHVFRYVILFREEIPSFTHGWKRGNQDQIQQRLLIDGRCHGRGG